MALGFKGGFAAFMDGYNKGEERKHNRDRQAKEDAWVQGQRDVKLAEQKRDDEFRSGMTKVNDEVEVAQPEVQGHNPSAYVPATTTRRAPNEFEKLDRYRGLYQAKGDVTQVLALDDAKKKLTMEDSAARFGQFQAQAQGHSIQDQLPMAIQIFNDAPNAGHIENVQFDGKGGVTFDAVNKSTGQKITKSFADPAKLMDDFHAYFSQGSWGKEVADRKAQAQAQKTELNKLHNVAPGGTVINGAGKVLFTAPERLRVGGVGGGGRSGGAGDAELAPNMGARLDPVKTYEGIYRDLFAQNAKAKELDPAAGQTEEQIAARARQLAKQAVDGFATSEIKSRQDSAITSRLGPLRSGMGANQNDYAGAYQQILRKGVTAEYLASIGFPPPQGWTGRR